MLNTGYVIVSRLRNLKRKQRLYYDENFRKLYFTSLSLLLVVVVSFVGNLTNKLLLEDFKFDQFSDNKLSLFIWSIAKTLAVLIYLAGKVYKDEFIELNRDRTEVIVSIFQKDLIGDLDHTERQRIQVTGDQEWLVSQIDE